MTLKTLLIARAAHREARKRNYEKIYHHRVKCGAADGRTGARADVRIFGK
jgi:hypothetical protein